MHELLSNLPENIGEIRVLDKSIFERKYPKAERLGEGEVSIAFAVRDNDNFVIKTNQRDPTAILTEAIALTRILGMNVDVSFSLSGNEIYIAVPRVKGLVVGTNAETNKQLVSWGESLVSKALIQGMAESILEAHKNGVTIGDVKTDQLALERNPNGGLNATMFDYSSGSVMPIIDYSAVAELRILAQDVQNYLAWEKKLASSVLEDFIKSCQNLGESSVDYWKIRSLLRVERIFEVLQIDRSQFNTVKTLFMTDLPRAPLIFGKSKGLKARDDEMIRRINAFKQLIKTPLETMRRLQDYTQNSDLRSLKNIVGKKMAAKLSTILGYSSESTTRTDKYPITYRLPTDTAHGIGIRELIDKVRYGYGNLSEAIDDILDRIMYSFWSNVIADWSQFVDELSEKAYSDQNLRMKLESIQRLLENARNFLERKDYRKLRILDDQIATLILV